jgi:hypothetical protein
MVGDGLREPAKTWMPEGTWTIDPADKGVLDFPAK